MRWIKGEGHVESGQMCRPLKHRESKSTGWAGQHAPGAEEYKCRVGRGEGGVDAVAERMLCPEAPG